MELFWFEKLTWKSFAVSLLAPLLMTLFFLQGVRAYIVGLYVTVWNIVLIPGSLDGNCISQLWDPQERIGYIFVSAGISVVQHGTVKSQASDNLPVFAEIRLPT